MPLLLGPMMYHGTMNIVRHLYLGYIDILILGQNNNIMDHPTKREMGLDGKS